MIEIKNRYSQKVIYTHKGETLAGAKLMGAKLRYTSLRCADLNNANLTSANLTYANLTYANLTYADLRGANLTYADLRGANLRETKTDQRFITISCIGSRKGRTTYCFDTDTIWCGCFKGTLQEFTDKVEQTHKDNPQYLKEYREATKFIKALREE